MFHSEPRGREGEPIEYIVPEAISVTASEAREGAGEPRWREGSRLASLLGSRGAVLAVAVTAVAEVLAFIAILALWGTC